MRFSNSILFAASALVSFVAAQSKVIEFTKTPNLVVPGTAYTLEWKTTDNTTPITIKLRVGPFNDLTDVSVLTSSATGGAYTWTPDKGLGDNSYYALEIIQGSQINYSGQISLSGGSSSVISTASATATASASSASSASASSASASSASASSASASSASTASTMSTATITGSSSSGTASSASKTGSASSGSLTAAASKTTGSAATTTGTAMGAPQSTGAASVMGSSPLALIFGAVAAMAYLN